MSWSNAGTLGAGRFVFVIGRTHLSGKPRQVRKIGKGEGVYKSLEIRGKVFWPIRYSVGFWDGACMIAGHIDRQTENAWGRGGNNW